MNKLLRSSKMGALALSAVVFLASAPMASAQVNNYPPSNIITTNGHGEVKARPDSLNVQVTVESRANTLAEARTENNKKMQAVVKALKSLNFTRVRLETQNLNVYPLQGEPQRDRLPKIIGYQATNSLSVTITGEPAESLGEMGSRIVDVALNAGANNVGGMNFFLADAAAAAVRTQALQLAVQDAKRNAEAMAQAAGVALTGLHSMEGSPQFGGFPRPMPMYAMKAAGAPAAEMSQTPVEAGETTITSDITARFKF